MVAVVFKPLAAPNALAVRTALLEGFVRSSLVGYLSARGLSILAEGAIALSVTLSGGALFAS